MPQLHFVKKARKTIRGEGIKKGDSYYWWKFRFGGKRVSKTRPRRSQLTQSDFWGQVFDIQDREKPDNYDDLQSEIESIKEDLETLRDEQEEKKSNMPDSLQESSSGELLQERYDSLEGVVSELESIDVPDKSDVLSEAGEDKDDKRGGQEILDEKTEEIWQELQDALGNING